MSEIVLGVRFLLELVTILGLVGGLFTSQSLVLKLFFVLLGIMIALIWSRYGAPKSTMAWTGSAKLLLEIGVFAIGSIGIYSLYGLKVGAFYMILAIVDLMALYAMGLNK